MLENNIINHELKLESLNDLENNSNFKSDIDNNYDDVKVIKINKDNLKTLIIEWLALDEQIKTYRDTIKDMNDEKKQYETQILELMNTLNQDTITTNKGIITRNKKESKGAITQELIKSTLSTLLKCQETADTYTSLIFDKRSVKEIINLKRKDFKINKFK